VRQGSPPEATGAKRHGPLVLALLAGQRESRSVEEGLTCSRKH